MYMSISTCDNSGAGGSSLVHIRSFNADLIPKSAGWAIRVRNQFRCLFTGRFEYNVIFPYCWKRRRLGDRSEEHTSELQSRPHLVCRLLLEKKKKRKRTDCRMIWVWRW